MSIPPTPAFTQMPNNLSELLKIGNNNIKVLKSGLTNITKVTNLTAKRVQDVAKTAKDVQKTVRSAKDITDNLKKGNFKKVNGNMANAIGFALSLASIGLSLMTINHVGNLQEIELRKDRVIEKDLSDAFQRAITNTLTFRKFREEFNKFKTRYDEDKGRLLNQVQESFTNSVESRELSEKAKQQANDALYETREGRKKLETKISEIINDFKQLVSDITGQNRELNTRIEESRKLGNDALYETRAGRKKLEAEINTKFQAARQLANDALYEVRAGRQKIEANFGQQLNSLRSTVNAQLNSIEAKSQQQVNKLFNDSRSIINNALSEARAAQAQTKALQQKVSRNQFDIGNLQQRIQNPQLNIDAKVRQLIASSPQIQGLIAGLKAAGVKVDGIERLLPALDTAVKTVGYKTQLIDGRVTKLETDIRLKDPGISRLDARIINLQTQINVNNSEIGGLKTRLNNKDSVDQRQFNDLVGRIALIPPLIARVPGDTVRQMPKPLTAPQVEAATSAGVCRSTKPGGCMNKALGDTADKVNQNTNNWGKNLLDKINAAANAAQLALLKKIDGKLGPQLPGGIGTVLKNFFDAFKSVAKWLHIDRALNVLTFAATVHNATQLSSDIVQTLASALSNALSLIGIKDDKGNALNISELVNGTIQNTIKGIVGEANYVSMSETWAKANRIYQSTTNLLNAFQGLSSAILTGLEMTAGKVGKIGNALRDAGEVLENAYGWMNPQPKFNRVTQFLENLQNGASTIQQVTQAPLDIIQATTELTNATTELTNAVKDDTKATNKGKESPEPDKLKSDKATAKTASAGLEVFDFDFDFDI